MEAVPGTDTTSHGGLMDQFGALFSGDPAQMAVAWLMLLVIGFFPGWIVLSYLRFALRLPQSKFRFHPAAILATCFNIGRLPKCAGTWGSLFTLYLLVWLLFMPRWTTLNPNTMLGILFGWTVFSCLGGIWACDLYGKRTGKHDPKEVVIDEMAGQLVAISLAALGFIALYHIDRMTYRPLLFLMPLYLVVLFLLFRLFDIWKPWIIGKADRNLHGGLGVMVDDILAGIASFIVFYLWFFAMHYSGGFFWIFATFFPDWIGPAPTHSLPQG